ncbi:hypothetical protein FRC19_003710 [Serendipita sp. 401]|nr:hypothetical protein FRC19_003710 [Serendipita sp. 401]KAG9056298.1 hypothetical protein FS842_011090 [Serendipita sp. 407]
MPDSFSYEEFQRTRDRLAIDNGVWFVWRSHMDDINCRTRELPWCQEGAGCISATVFRYSSQPQYTFSLYTKIALDLAAYRNYTALEYEWQYLPWWGNSKQSVGLELGTSSSVGNDVYKETLRGGNYSQLWDTGEGWNYPPFRYKGSTYLTTNADETIGYMPIYINITFPGQGEETIDYFVKAISLNITSPPASIITNSTLQAGGCGTSTSTGSPISSESRPIKLTVGSFVGIIIGVFALPALVAIVFFRMWRMVKAGNHEQRNVVVQVASIQDNTPSDEEPNRPFPIPLPAPAATEGVDIPFPSAQTSVYSSPPPCYGENRLELTTLPYSRNAYQATPPTNDTHAE